METVAVGLVSLVVGLALGFALSQGMSFVTAGLFNIEMTQYRFIFSFDAFLLTLMCFAIIFAVTALFNTVSVSYTHLLPSGGTCRSCAQAVHATNLSKA